MAYKVKGEDKSINDGYFEIKYEKAGVFLVVNPPIGNGKSVDVREVLEKITKKQIKNFNKEMIEISVARADKVPIRIAEAQEEIKINATVSIMVTPDKMKAFVSFTSPENGRMLTVEEVIDALEAQGVIYGIHKTTLETITKYPVYNEMICIAEGTPPVTGENGSIKFHFDIKKDRKPTILEDGRVDFRELNLVESVRKGQVLCTIIPPKPGSKGKTVVGTDIPALDGKPVPLPRGRNVELSEDEQSLLASIDGQVTYIDGKVNVFATYEVPADVDNSTGNIYFVGNVSIRGNVLSGFVVEAGGNVEVWGVVEGAVIKAGGDIILRRGMQGLGKGILVSGGDIVARYIENSNVEARNDIKAETIMHSNIKCGNKLELSGRKGLLVGGTCRVGKEITAKVIGSYMSTTTDIEVGVDPTLRENYRKAKEEALNIESDIKKADQAIRILKKFEAAGVLTPEKEELLTKSMRTKVFYSNRLEELNKEISSMDERLQQESHGKVRAYNYIYPGTRIAIGSSMMYVKENLQYCTIYRDGADVRVGAIDR